MKLEDEHAAPEADNRSSTESVSRRMAESTLQEGPPQVMEVTPQLLRRRTRRDVLLLGVGAIATVAGGGFLLPQPTLERLGVIHGKKTWPRKEGLLNRALRIDDDVAEALYSGD